ncbi:MAG: hypothetical protein Q4D58_01245 [Synergistaceae bacterium]|nr:hypothetical protein [Synergistaceae bacterium]
MKIGSVIFCLFAALALLAAPAHAAADGKGLEELLEVRQSDIWIEGERLGDMMLGSRGTMQLIYVDKTLSDHITGNSRLQQWVYEMAQYFGSEAARKKALFIAHIETYKPWDFDYTKVFVGGYHLKKADILSPSMTNPFGPLASEEKGHFAFVVPASELKKGETIELGYGEYSEKWNVPK